MQRLDPLPLQYEFSRHLPPRLRVEPGEVFEVESEDALSGQIRSNSDRHDKSTVPYSNPVAGPIWVAGAEPGDALAVTLHEIRPRDGQCATYTAAPRLLTEWLGSDVPHGAHVCPIRDGVIHWYDRVTIPYEPMLGCIGVAPDWGVPTTGPAGSHGGNLDLVEVCPGNTIYFPVYVPGGLLYLGDAHAAMGHGELSAVGLEMAALTTASVEVVKRPHWTGVRIAGPNEIMAVATGSPMERSLAEAYSRLILWLEAEHGFTRWHAYDLLTHVARVSVGYYAYGTVAVKIARRYLA